MTNNTNGTGSFYHYKVSMMVDNGEGQQVGVQADTTSNNNNIYSCVPGVIVNSANGVQVHNS